jgi:tetratricopeptide (TPR) repeat protein
MTVDRRTGIGRELGVLEGAGLISLATTDPELEYLFRHVLIQDAAYESLLKQERRSLHVEVAEALIALYPDHEDDLSPVLAHHFERAEDRPRSIEYLARAARKAKSRFARHEAVDLALRAIAIIGADAEVPVDERRLRAEMHLLAAEEGIDHTPADETGARLKAALGDAEALEDADQMTRVWLLVAFGLALSGDQYRSSPDLADALDRADELARASGRADLIALAAGTRAQAYYAASEFPAAIQAMEEAVPMLEATGQTYQASMVAGQLGTSYGHVGQFDRAVEWTTRAFELGERSGDPNASLDADLARAIVEGIRGDSTLAIDYATKAASVAERVDNKACELIARSVMGEEQMKLGDAAGAAIAFEASAGLASFCQFMPVKIQQTELLLQTARSRAGVGRVAFERYERALELARQFGDRLAEGQLHEQRARDRIASGQTANVGDDLARAAALFETLGASAHLQRIRELETTLA